jgi:serine/threonine protein phosphatase PrpC
MKQIMKECLSKTNKSLLDSDINTELSGSTVVAVFIYRERIICYNIGDSRAILVRQIK